MQGVTDPRAPQIPVCKSSQTQFALHKATHKLRVAHAMVVRVHCNVHAAQKRRRLDASSMNVHEHKCKLDDR